VTFQPWKYPTTGILLDMFKKCDVLIVGAGVVGLSIGIAILQNRPDLKVIIADKENDIGLHASGRNSGVIHAGFYYSPDSLKAKFCRDGNFELRNLARKYAIPIRDVGKVVVTRNNDEDSRLNTLFQRGIANGVELEIYPEEKLKDFEPLAVTHNRFLWSPNTGISDPFAILEAIKDEFLSLGGEIHFASKVELTESNGEVYDSGNHFRFRHVVNAAGAQADRISRSVGVGSDYAMLPFMGVYRATSNKNLSLQRLVYPVPHPINPFLGVHFTLTIDGKVKIGPTAIPIAGREQYSLTEGWSVSDIAQALKGMKSLVAGDAHDFVAILKSEWPKIIQKLLVKESAGLVPSAIGVKDWHRNPPGIRAQLVHLPTGKLEQDFIVNSQTNATHILNAVSPGWTSSIPFGRYVSEKFVLSSLN
jgi:L-2-hydroxyglutarate oxidase